MEKIVVSLPKSGAIPWCTQHYRGQEMQDMVIPSLARCLGVTIFWKPKSWKHHSMCSVTALHLPTFLEKNSITVEAKRVIRTLLDEMYLSEPYLLVVRGGRNKTQVDKNHYNDSTRKFVMRFAYQFPDMQVCTILPEEQTLYTTVFIKNWGDITIETINIR